MFVVVAIILVLLAPILRSAWGGLAAYVWTPWRADSLLTGTLIAVAVRNDRLSSLLRSHLSTLYAALIALLSGAALLTITPGALGAADHTWLACLYGVLLVLAVLESDSLIARLLRAHVLQWLGAMSYGLYMYHQAVSGMIHGFLGDGVPSLDSFLGCTLTLMSLLLTIILTMASFRFFEQPFLELGHRFKYLAESANAPATSNPIH